MSTSILSPQQAAAIDFVTSGGGNAILRAVAGSGKTYTLVEMCQHIPDGTPAVFLAFNKKIADELKHRLYQGSASRSIMAGTFHSLGLRAWNRVSPLAQVEGTKVEIIMEQLDVPKHLRAFVKALVSLSRQAVIKPEDVESMDSLIDHHDLEEKLNDESGLNIENMRLQATERAQAVFAHSNAACDRMIDFDDMVYAPLYFNVDFPQFQWVLIDEAQDTNNARRLMAMKLLAPGGRFVAVGDPRQAIYGFTGADADALDIISRTFNCTDLPLTVSYRCAQAIVRHAQQIVEDIQAADNAPEGIVSTMPWDTFEKITPESTDAILCRNTRPLVELALEYIRRRVPAHVEGRDIGQSLLALVRKWKTPKTIEAFLDRLEQYQSEESAKLVERRLEHKIDGLRDRVGSIIAIASTLHDDEPLSALERAISTLFQDTEGRPVQSITLSTVHKSKGREWNRVYLYGRDKYMPSKYARQEWQQHQENNLIYVAITRAKRELVEVSLLTTGGQQ